MFVGVLRYGNFLTRAGRSKFTRAAWVACCVKSCCSALSNNGRIALAGYGAFPSET